MILKAIYFFSLCFIFCHPAFAQETDTLALPAPAVVLDSLPSLKTAILGDSIPVKKRNFLGRLFHDKNYPNPKKALFLSILVPGTGQIYNKQYWKLPIVYGAYTAAILNIRKHRQDVKLYRTNLRAELDDLPGTVNMTQFNANALRGLRDNALSKTETGYLILFLLHALQTSDAFVFAHLKTFDVSEDLSMHISPQVGMSQQLRPHAGVQFLLTLRPASTPTPTPF